ncbi:hypothetical protein ANN_11248 [Periplaneta americana]|uniref:Transposase Tc1-like domain-containing protein n=1 Tax=Periplaneta americana TaxID=6978 RepID=A0ABQ8T616_PERAM|nr:hypothetical protein ANN_11248 [Periplaneta americana]
MESTHVSGTVTIEDQRLNIYVEKPHRKSLRSGVCDELPVDHSIVSPWATRFRASLDDDARPGRPKTSTHKQNEKLVADALQEDRRAMCEQFSETTRISINSVFRILTKNLKKRKFSAHWIPHCLTAEQKQKHLGIANLLTGPSRKREAQRETVLWSTIASGDMDCSSSSHRSTLTMTKSSSSVVDWLHSQVENFYDRGIEHLVKRNESYARAAGIPAAGVRDAAAGVPIAVRWPQYERKALYINTYASLQARRSVIKLSGVCCGKMVTMAEERRRPYISETNRARRLDFAKEHVGKDEEFWNRVIWSDETKIKLYGSDGINRAWRKPNSDNDINNTLPIVKTGVDAY